MIDRLEFLPAGIFGGGDEEVGSLGAAHPDGVVLAALAPADFPDGVLLDAAKLGMGRGEYWATDDPKPFRWVVIIDELDPLGHVSCPGLIEGGPRALDKGEFVRVCRLGEDTKFGDVGVAKIADPDICSLDQWASAVDAFFILSHGIVPV